MEDLSLYIGTFGLMFGVLGTWAGHQALKGLAEVLDLIIEEKNERISALKEMVEFYKEIAREKK